MALRLIKMVIQEDGCLKISDIVKKHKVVEYPQVQLPNNEFFYEFFSMSNKDFAAL